MTLLNNPEKADDEEGEEGENGAEKTQEEQPEVIEDDLIKTPGKCGRYWLHTQGKFQC